MVKTRHHQDTDDESNGTFLSLDDRRSKQLRNLNRNEEDSDDSGVVKFRRSSMNEEDELPKRSTRTSAKRVSYLEDYVEDSESDADFQRHTRRGHTRRIVTEDDFKSRRGRSRKKSEEDEEEHLQTRRGRSKKYTEEEEEHESGEEETRSQRQRPRRGRRSSRDSDNDESCIQRKPRKTSDYIVSHPSPRQVKMEMLADDGETGIRRSSRARRMMYPTYNQKVLENGYEEDMKPLRKRQRRDVDTEDMQNDDEFADIYSRVKRQRKTVKRDMYGMPIETDNEDAEDNDEEGDEDDGSDDSSDDEDNDSEENDDGNEENDEDGDDDNGDDDDDADDRQSDERKTRRSYNLRVNKPRTQHYIAPVQERRQRSSRFLNDEVSTPHSPARRRRSEKLSYLSPARKRGPIKRRHRAFHGSSSTSSSDSSSDEERFQRRKAKSMMKARQRCLPMNFDPDDISRSTLLRDRQKIGASLADVDPMNIDRSIRFDSVGGLGKHIRALKEMVVFPLLYPEIFERFKIAPPRGVLFYGPPGTGKTLVARALANECSTDDRRVAFYMRKGADCLSKWVGESERQLRLLFDQAYQSRPSIIFFDEIDGLAPVRSSRQDQIHSSIVSTLLALMDGLDSRGEVVVIGATNRLDSIDPALRRPGRFDREFLFPLPSVQARSQILKIHTKEWNPQLCDKFVSEVAEKCVGYCGADMKALCTEASLLALRRRYPQIYTSAEKLQIDVSSINIAARDFYNAMRSIVPASQRSVTSPARALSTMVIPLLQNLFLEILGHLNQIFPSVLMQLSNLDATVTEAEGGSGDAGRPDMEACSDDEERDVSIFEHKIDKRRKQSNIPELPDSFLNLTSYAHRHPSTHRPRLLLAGHQDQGQTSHLAPAVIHYMEQLPVHTLDLSALYANSARTPEESCAQLFREAKRTAPSIIYLPHVNQWWHVIGETVKRTVITLLHDLDPYSPVLLLATSEELYTDLDYSLQDLFDEFCGEVVVMRNSSFSERREFFKDLLLNQATKPPPQRKLAAQRVLEVLPKAPPPEPRKLTDVELRKLQEHEESTLTELRLFLRDTLNKLGRDRKFFIFTKPVDIEDVPDYYDIIKKPMDLSTMMSKIDLHQYQSVKEFMEDIDQICLNALEYNPDKDPQSRVIRHRACALKDTAAAIIKAELDPEFEQICESIVSSRKQRGEDGTRTAPAFYYTRPLNQGPMHPLAITKSTTSTIPAVRDASVRLSRRLQGVDADNGPSLEEVERSARALRRLQMSPSKETDNNSTPQGQLKKHTQSSSKSNSGRKIAHCGSSGSKPNSSSKSSNKRPVKKDIWGRKSYNRRRRRLMKRKREDSEEEDFTEIIDDGDDNDENNDEMVTSIDDNDEEMEDVEASDGTVQRSPRRDGNRSPRRSSTDRAQEKSDKFNECLSVDVDPKPLKDGTKSPSQRSPRSETYKTPQTRSHQESPTRSRSPRDGGHMTRRNSSGGRSPRSQEFHNSSVQEEPKPQKSLSDTAKPSSCDNQNSTDKVPSALNRIGKTLVQGYADSGLGSSDSNGDSNDSIGRSTSSSLNSEAIVTAASQVTSEHQNEQDNTASSKDVSPVFHLTRSRVQTRAQEQAAEVLLDSREPVVVDRERLVQLLDETARLTEGYILPRLEKLYNMFAQCIYQHRLEYNKTDMIYEMEKRLAHYTTSISERLKREQNRAETVL